MSLLPLRILYLLSDGMYLLLYYVIGYRKQLVLDNLRHAFPLKTQEEIHTICKKFYRNFCDQWTETLKLLSISQHELNRRIRGNWEVFHQLHKEGLNTYALLGHTFNWEWANVACQYNCKQQFAGVYMPQKSDAADKLLNKIRSRSGAWLISMKAKRGFERLNNVHYIVGLIADQNPPAVKAATWYNFMHREAPFFNGPEVLAKRANAAVVFAGIKKIRRGYYEIVLTKYTDNAAALPKGEIMQAYVRFMEEQIKGQPENWMWTHNRWKHSR
ncbi:MAG: lysophospholipid acyltransferase family protein [Taibaiella sp.]|nr:lysophospholipid acyltransferase family protein [Taibaiella sp.]